LANAAAALKRTCFGGRTDIPRVEEVFDLIRTRGEGIFAGAPGKEARR
jgi:hypothetical protein